MITDDLQTRLYKYIGGIIRAKKGRVRTFEEEYIEFLERHEITFERRFLFDDEHHG